MHYKKLVLIKLLAHIDGQNKLGKEDPISHYNMYLDFYT